MPASLQSSVNHWPQSKCARAFWGQHELPPYRKLLADTASWLEPAPGERWLDLGCGCGKLTEALWVKSDGKLLEVVGLDCAAENERAYRRLVKEVQPPAAEGQIRFVCADFSEGLASWQDGIYDGVVSGLSIQYAESYATEHGCWTTDAYDRLLSEVHRVLRPGGSFVFSVNVPEPAWSKLALGSLGGVFAARRPAHYLKKAVRMWRYGVWLSREARRGRFHYLPLEVITRKLSGSGFTDIDSRVTYAGIAYLIRCRKPA